MKQDPRTATGGAALVVLGLAPVFHYQTYAAAMEVTLYGGAAVLLGVYCAHRAVGSEWRRLGLIVGAVSLAFGDAGILASALKQAETRPEIPTGLMVAAVGAADAGWILLWLSGRAPKQREGGFTLVEMVVVIALTALVVGSTAIVTIEAAEASALASTRKELMDSVTPATERMTREIRAVRTATTGDIPLFGPQAFTFVDVDGATVAYALVGSDLMRGTNVLCRNVQSLTFEYLKKDGAAATSASEIWTVRLSLTAAKAGETVTLRTQIHPRRFGASLSSWKEN